MDFADRSCYDRPMRAFICEVKHPGLRRLLPADLVPANELDGLTRGPSRTPAAVVRALLEEPDADDLRTEVTAGRHHDACGLLLNRAIALMTISVSLPHRAGTIVAARLAAAPPSRT